MLVSLSIVLLSFFFFFCIALYTYLGGVHYPFHVFHEKGFERGKKGLKQGGSVLE